MFTNFSPLKNKRQFIIRYRKAGLWFAAFFPTVNAALTYTRRLKQNPAVDRITLPKEYIK